VRATPDSASSLPTVVSAAPGEVARRILASRMPGPGDPTSHLDASSPDPDAPLPRPDASAARPPGHPAGGNGLTGDDASSAAEQDASIFDLADFQEAAVRGARSALARWGGVLIADSVGLGKTYVGLALVEEAVRAGGEAMVVVPAALRRTWRPGLDRLQRATGRRVPLVSHTRLALGRVPDSASDRVFPTRIGRLLVVVDEAHAFRNRRTKRYRALARLCHGAHVALLTATPVNNSVLDLYALIRLFARDDAFRDLGVPALRAAFRQADTGPVGPILPVLKAVIIRRTRPAIRDRYGAVRLPGSEGGNAVLAFPRSAPPHAVRYRLFEHPATFDAVADSLLAIGFVPLRLASCSGRDGAGELETDGGAEPGGRAGMEPRARPGTDPRRRGGVAELMRLALLKRLESGRHAFRLSVERQLRYHEAFADALARGFLLPARVHRALAGDGEAVQLLLEPVALEPLPRSVDSAHLAKMVAGDIARLRMLRTAAHTASSDPKLDALLALIGKLAGQKVVVFTEFRDTATYLWRGLLAAGVRTGRVDGAGAFLGQARAGRRAVIDRFAPRANDAREPPARERVDVLVATDVLAEGLNLQDAAHVVSYDLPWNPVRLIQRVGRIDRLGSPHDVVYPHFLLPGPELERLLGLHARIRAKLAAIGDTVGLDGTVLDDEDAEESVVQRLARGDPRVLDDLERAEAGPLPGLIQRPARGQAGPVVPVHTDPMAEGAPSDVRCARVPSQASLVALEMDGTVFWLVIDGARARIDEDAAAEILDTALRLGEEDTTPGEAPSAAVALESAVLVLEAARDEASRRGLARLPPVQDPQAPAARAARWLQRHLGHAESRLLEPGLVDRIDRLLRRLARPPDAAMEARIHDALRAAARARWLEQVVVALEEATYGWSEESDASARKPAATGKAGEAETGAKPEAARIRWVGALIGDPPTESAGTG
jgi:hypothetical protein